MKTTAFPRLGIEASKEAISLRIFGKAFTDLSGLSTLMVLKPLRLGMFGMNSMTPIQTTEKSIQFQGYLK